MNCNIICSDGILQSDLDIITNCSDLCTLFRDTCVCSATLHLPSLTCDAVSLAMVMVKQVVKAPMIRLVEPVFSLLGIPHKHTDIHNSALDPSTGDLKVIVLVTVYKQ